MLKRYTIKDSKPQETEAESSPVLLYVNPDETERRFLVEQLKIDEHTLNSSLDPQELGRVEFEPDHLALIIKRPKRYTAQDNFLFKIESIGLFLFKERLVVVVTDDIQLLSGRHFNRVGDIVDFMTRIIYGATFHFEEHLKVISMCSDDLERDIHGSVSNRQLLHMFTLEKSLVFYLEAISSNSRVIEKLKAYAGRIGFSTAHAEFLDDIAIETAQCYEMAQISSQVLSGLMDARASVISNNLNILMKNLNALVIAVAVPSFFAGVGGMSELTTLFGEENLLIAYALFVLAMVGVGWATYRFIKKAEKLFRE